LINNRENLSPGDLIFWGSEDDIKNISIIYQISGDQIRILYGNRISNRIETINLEEYNDFENIIAYAKILK
jgi:hypothetical protein